MVFILLQTRSVSNPVLLKITLGIRCFGKKQKGLSRFLEKAGLIRSLKIVTDGLSGEKRMLCGSWGRVLRVLGPPMRLYAAGKSI